MSGDTDKTKTDSSCGCRSNNVNRGSRKWIWLLLLLAILGIVIAKQVTKQRSGASSAATGSLIASETSDAKQSKSLPRLVELGADKCQACKMMVPVIDALKKEYAELFVTEFIDVWEQPEAAKPHKVKLIPTQIFYDANGKELFRHEGFFSKDDIIAKWQELGVGL